MALLIGRTLVLGVALNLIAGGRLPAAQADEFAAQRALFDYDQAIPLGLVDRGVELRGEVSVQDLTFNGLSGGPIPAYVVTPKGPGPFAAVLWVHWLGEPETTNRTEFLNEAVALASQGVVSVLVDAMWSAPDWFMKRDPDQDYRNSIQQVIALRRAMDLLLSQPNVDSARVGVVGHDYGGMYSMIMAGVDLRARACVYVAVVPSLNDWAFLGPQPSSKAAYLRQNAMLELSDYLKKNRKAATFLQFGAQDIYVSRVEAGMVAAAAGTQNRKFYDTDHAMALPEIASDRAAFLVKELGVPAPGPATPK